MLPNSRCKKSSAVILFFLNSVQDEYGWKKFALLQNKNNCCSIVKKLLGLVLLIKEEIFLLIFHRENT